MSKTIIIKVPEELYTTLQKVYKDKAEEEIGEELLQIIKNFLDVQLQRMDDPIFKPITLVGSALSDVSEHHDKYLYGK